MNYKPKTMNMRILSKDLTKYLMYFVASIFAVGVTGCNGDDDVDDVLPDPDATGSITVENQTISGNTLILENVTVGQDSWIVVRNADEDEMVSDPVMVEEGMNQDVSIPLNNLATLEGDEDGDDFDVYLYSDNPNAGTMGTYDEGIDEPIRDDMDMEINERVTATTPSIFGEDNQMVSENREVTFSSVNTGPSGGYIGLYGEDEEGNIDEENMIGFSDYIAAGSNENVTATFNEDYQYAANQNVYPRLFTDNPADQNFTFTESGGTEDLPDTYGYDSATGTASPVWNTSETGSFTIGNSAGGTDM